MYVFAYALSFKGHCDRFHILAGCKISAQVCSIQKEDCSKDACQEDAKSSVKES